MPNNETLGASFTIDTTNLKAGLAQANRMIRESESEFKAAAAGLDDWSSSAEGVEARIKYLNDATDLQRKKVDALKDEYNRLINDGLDPMSRQAVDLRTKINNETTALNKNEKELIDQKEALEQLTAETDDAAKKTDDMTDSVEKSNKGLSAVKGVAGVAGKAIAALGAAAVGAVAGFLSLAESTREYREDMAKLETAFTSAGLTTEQATETYKDFFAVLGEEDRSVEAVNHLAKMVDTQQDLDKWTQICTGVWATFGDSLPIEGLTEAANETAKTGTLTGVLADALNWAGVNEEDFQAKLDACNSERERTALITDTLNGLYDDAADKYKELNADVMEAQRAQSELTDAIADLGAIAEPIMTDLKLLVADLVQEITPFVELIGNGLQGALDGSEGAAEDFAAGISGLIDTLVDGVVDALPMVLDVITRLIPSIVNTILDATPQILEAVIDIITQIIAVLSETLPQIVTKIMDIIPVLVMRLIEAAPQVLAAAVTLLMSIVEAIPTIIDGLLDDLPNILNTIVDFLVESIPILLEAAIELLNAIIDAIPVIIQSLIQNLPRIINTIISGVLEALPLLLNAAITLFMEIINAIPQILPELIRALPRIITTITDTLLSHLDDIIQCAIQLFFGILEAIPQIIAELIKQLPTIISTIVDTLMGFIPEMIQAGIDLLGGLITGLLNPSTLWNAIKSLGESILDGIKEFFGINSPSTVFRDEIGKNLALGIGKGFQDNIKGVKAAMVKSMDGMSAELGDVNVSASGSAAGGQGSGAAGGGQQIVVNQYNTYAQAHSRYELFKTKQNTAAAVRLATAGGTA